MKEKEAALASFFYYPMGFAMQQSLPCYPKIVSLSDI